MTEVAFVGLGNMGGPMAANLLKVGHRVVAFDLDAAALARAVAGGARAASSPGDAAASATTIITMLPAGAAVRAVYEGAGGLIERAPAGALLIDASTIDVATARAVNECAAVRGLAMADAPVSGGVTGAAAASLTFMVGGQDDAVARARPVLAAMGKTVVHTGGPGTGQAAKICNNLILGISMTAVAEAFVLADALGLERQRLFDVASTSSGQCWSLTTYCPVPGPVPTSPANREYAPGFTAEMMLKDLKLAMSSALESGTCSPLGASATALYELLRATGHGKKDFSYIIKMIEGNITSS
ncbi:MAG: 3-hydroxyisobutyrate dehydrogenase [Pseudomonadota bacterium]